MIITLGNTIKISGGQYERIKYPAGEMQIRFDKETVERITRADEITVLARIYSADQIIELRLLLDAIQGIYDPARTVNLVLPYLPYARADRRFQEGDCLGIRTFAELLGGVPSKIITLDAHSDKASQWFRRLVDIPAMPYIEEAIRYFGSGCKELNILFPDEGAKKRYKIAAQVENINITVYNASKVRDPLTGKLSRFEVPLIDPQKPVLIVDDICDGGGTFLGIAKELEIWHVGKRGLYVTHGIFSKGFEDLSCYFDNIYTTDSFTTHDYGLSCTVIPAVEDLLTGEAKVGCMGYKDM